MKINIICDRCKKQVEGIKDSFFDKETNKTYEYTGGYYEIFAGSYWEQFAADGETNICDDCMHNNLDYQVCHNLFKSVN